MGWLDGIKSLFSKIGGYKYAGMLSGRYPIYSQFGRDIYASDVVVQATKCVTDEIKKLSPTHVINNGSDVTPVGNGDSIQRVLNNPNHYMTTADFLAKVMYTYFQKSNSWIVPVYRTDANGRRTYTGLYPVDPERVEWLEDINTGALSVSLKFTDGTELVLPYSDVIHLRRDYGASGISTHSPFTKNLNIKHKIQQVTVPNAQPIGIAVLHQFNASRRTNLTICCLLAPIHRIMPKNFVRCATLLFIQLEIIKTPEIKMITKQAAASG